MGRKRKNASKRNQAQNRRKQLGQSETTITTAGKDKCDLDSTCAPFGLTNLGNTCYFNSVLQVLSRTPLLVHLLHSKLNDRSTWRGTHVDQLVAKHCADKNEFTTEDGAEYELTNGHEEQENVSNGSDMPSTELVPAQELTQAFFELMKEMQTPRSPSKRVITPSRLRKALAKKSRQFCDRDEQDSHELLRTLIDLIRSDEIRRHRLAIYDWLQIPRDASKQNNVDDDTKALVKAHGASCNFTTVDSLFSGYLLSSIQCHECGNTTQILEQMFDLSVPVSETKFPHECIKKQYSANKLPNNSNGNRTSKASPLPRQEPSEVEQLDSIASRSDDSIRANADLDDSDARMSDFLADVDLPDSADAEDILDSDDQMLSREDDIPLAPDDDLNDGIDQLTLECKEQSPSNFELPARMCTPSPQTYTMESTQVNGSLHSDRGTSSDTPCNKSLIKWSLRTVGHPNVRRSESKNNTSPTLEACLSAFTLPELLTGSNRLFCENCTKLAREKKPHKLQQAASAVASSSKKKTSAGEKVKIYSNASKHFLIAYPPVILTIHLKRFHVEGYGNVNLRKINRHVDFSLELDLSPWVSQAYSSIGEFIGVNEKSPDSSLKYRLYGLVEHSGTLRGGHYTAKIRVDTNCKGKKVTSNRSKYLRMRPFVPSFDTFLKQLPIGAETNNDASSNEPPNDMVQSKVNAIVDHASTICSSDDNDRDSATSPADDTAQSDCPSNECNRANEKSQWYHCCDSNVRPVTLDEVTSSQAYLLFYERI